MQLCRMGRRRPRCSVLSFCHRCRLKVSSSIQRFKPHPPQSFAPKGEQKHRSAVNPASYSLSILYLRSRNSKVWTHLEMGKNQAYKAMQRARLGSTSAGPEEIEDGLMDGSFHSPEWHAARLASLNMSHTITWEEFKRKQKEDELKKGELEADKDKMMREYRAQLDAERARKLSLGRNHSDIKLHHKKGKKSKDLKKRSSRKRKRRSSSSSSSSSYSESSSSDDEERRSKKSRSSSRLKKGKKERKHRSRTKDSSSDSEGRGGPVRLSRFFGNVKR